MRNIIPLLILLAWLAITNGMDKSESMDYLVHYGYMPDKNESMYSTALRKYQKFAGINVTGVMDNKTDEMMRKPRCGNKDIMMRKNKGYTIHGSKWRLRNINYNIVYPINTSRTMIADSLKKAFEKWTNHTGIAFTNTEKKHAHIHISFGNLKPGQLGIAFYPIFGGNITFSHDINWSNGDGSNFLTTAMHEIGHSLGLGHSQDKYAVMAPYSNGFKEDLTLDDITAIRILYSHD